MAWAKPQYSQALKMRYSINDDGRVMTEDKTIYSADEVCIISEAGEITPQIHMVKRVLDGTVIRNVTGRVL